MISAIIRVLEGGTALLLNNILKIVFIIFKELIVLLIPITLYICFVLLSFIFVYSHSKEISLNYSSFISLYKRKFKQNIIMVIEIIIVYFLVQIVILNSFEILFLLTISYFMWNIFIIVGIITSAPFLKMFCNENNKKRIAILLWLSTTIPIFDIFALYIMDKKCIIKKKIE